MSGYTVGRGGYIVGRGGYTAGGDECSEFY